MGFPNLPQMVSQENDVRYRDKRADAGRMRFKPIQTKKNLAGEEWVHSSLLIPFPSTLRTADPRLSALMSGD